MFKNDPYLFLQREIKNDVNFDFIKYVIENNLLKQIKNWSTAKTILNDYKTGYAASLLVKKPGLKLIDYNFIKKTLTEQKFQEFYSWKGYCTIINYINEIFYYGYERPFKSRQLFLVRELNTGKTSLIRKISTYVSTYEMGVTKWWPQYKDFTYKLLVLMNYILIQCLILIFLSY